MATKKYTVKDIFKGCTIGTIPPTYLRKEGGRFILDDGLSQKDMGYLYEVIGHEAIVKNEQKDTDTSGSN